MLSFKRMQRKQKTVSNTPDKQAANQKQLAITDQDNHTSQDEFYMTSSYLLAIPSLAVPAAILSAMVFTSDMAIYPQLHFFCLVTQGSTLVLSSITFCITAFMGGLINEKAADELKES